MDSSDRSAKSNHKSPKAAFVPSPPVMGRTAEAILDFKNGWEQTQDGELVAGGRARDVDGHFEIDGEMLAERAFMRMPAMERM